MSEFDEKLEKTLNDPQAMQEIMNMAAAINGKSGETGGGAGLDSELLSRVMRMFAR